MAKGLAARDHFNPADYKFVAGYYLGDDYYVCREYVDDMNLIERIGQLDKLTGKCGSCGTRHKYGALYRNVREETYLAVGNQCAWEYFSHISDADFRKAEARKARERAQAAEIAAEKRAEFEADAENAALVTEMEKYRDNDTVLDDMLRSLDRKGFLTDGQIGYAKSIVEKQARWEIEDAEWAAERTEVVEGRYEMTGELLTVKWVENDFSYNGGSMKMLVMVDTEAGKFKVWGTYPEALYDGDAAQVGDRVTFTAAVERSEKDPYFGYFKRPTKARVIEKAAASDAPDQG